MFGLGDGTSWPLRILFSCCVGFRAMPWRARLRDTILSKGLCSCLDDEGFVATYRLNAGCPPPKKVFLQMALLLPCSHHFLSYLH